MRGAWQRPVLQLVAGGPGQPDRRRGPPARAGRLGERGRARRRRRLGAARAPDRGPVPSRRHGDPRPRREPVGRPRPRAGRGAAGPAHGRRVRGRAVVLGTNLVGGLLVGDMVGMGDRDAGAWGLVIVVALASRSGRSRWIRSGPAGRGERGCASPDAGARPSRAAWASCRPPRDPAARQHGLVAALAHRSHRLRRSSPAATCCRPPTGSRQRHRRTERPRANEAGSRQRGAASRSRSARPTITIEPRRPVPGLPARRPDRAHGARKASSPATPGSCPARTCSSTAGGRCCSTRSPVQFFSARFEYTNEGLLDRRRRSDRAAHARASASTARSGGVHEDLDLVNYGRRTVRLTIEMEIASDFADIFDVKAGGSCAAASIDTRAGSARAASCARTTSTGDFGASWSSRWTARTARAQFANGRLVFVARDRAQGRLARLPPLAADHSAAAGGPSTLPCNARRGARCRDRRATPAAVSHRDANETVGRAWDQAIARHRRAAARGPGVRARRRHPGRRRPWFVTLFGRDSLIVSMQTISGYPGVRRRRASPAVAASRRPATTPSATWSRARSRTRSATASWPSSGILPFHAVLRHPRRDEPVRHRPLVPVPLARRRSAVRRATCPTPRRRCAGSTDSGDRDRDGFQEYKTRSTHGYYNQGWKDAGDAIPHADGSLAPLPIALCELQGYAYDAKLRMADIYDLLGRPTTRPAARPRRPSCTTGSTTRSGGRPRAPTTSASTATSARSGPWPRTPATA